MLETSRVAAQLERARAFADRIGLRPQLELHLAVLDRYAHPTPTRCVLLPDPALHSFHFVMEKEKDGEWTTWFEGTLVYEGPRDDQGSDAHPEFPVRLYPKMGWTIRA